MNGVTSGDPNGIKLDRLICDVLTNLDFSLIMPKLESISRVSTYGEEEIMGFTTEGEYKSDDIESESTGGTDENESDGDDDDDGDESVGEVIFTKETIERARQNFEPIYFIAHYKFISNPSTPISDWFNAHKVNSKTSDIELKT